MADKAPDLAKIVKEIEKLKKQKNKNEKKPSWKPTSRRVFKKDKQATVVYKGSNPSYHFKKEYQQEKNLLAWGN